MSFAAVIGRNTAYSLVARLAVMGAWFLLTPGLLTTLGPERFGFWSLLLAVGGLVGTADLGLGVAVSRFTADHVRRGHTAGIGRLLGRALLLQFAVAATVAALALLARDRLLDWIRVAPEWRDEARTAFELACAGFLLAVPFNLFTAVLQGLQRMDLFALVSVPGALALLGAVSYAIGAGHPLLGVTAAQAAVLLALALASGWAVSRALAVAPSTAPAVGDAPVRFRSLFGFSLWVQVNAALALAQQHLSKFLIAGLVALGPVAAYELGLRVTSVATLLPILALAALLPAMVHRAGGDTVGEYGGAYVQALAPYFVLVTALSGALVALAPAILETWLGKAGPDEVLALRTLALAGAAGALTGVASTTVRAAGRPRFETEFGVAVLVLHLVLSLVGRAWLGWPGVLYGLAAASWIAAPLFVARVERWLGLGTLGVSARALAAPAVAAAGAGLAAWGVVLWRGSSAPGRVSGALTLALASVVFALAYATILRVVSPETSRRVWGLWARMRMRTA